MECVSIAGNACAMDNLSLNRAYGIVKYMRYGFVGSLPLYLSETISWFCEAKSHRVTPHNECRCHIGWLGRDCIVLAGSPPWEVPRERPQCMQKTSPAGLAQETSQGNTMPTLNQGYVSNISTGNARASICRVFVSMLAERLG